MRKYLLATTIVLMIATNNIAKADVRDMNEITTERSAAGFMFHGGGQEGSGGDPIAAEFLNVMMKLSAFLSTHQSIARDADRFKMRSVVSEMFLSLNTANNQSEIQVVEDRPRDRFGIQKAAVFTMSPQSIRIHRQSWLQSTSKDRIVLGAMELFGLAGMTENRYQSAENEISQFTNEILNQEVATGEGYHHTDAETIRTSENLIQALQKTEYIDCQIGSTDPSYSRYLYLVKSGKTAIHTEMAWDGPDYFFENLFPSRPIDPLEMRMTGVSFGRGKLEFPGQLRRLSLYVLLDESQKKVLTVSMGMKKLIRENTGTIINPIYQDVWKDEYSVSDASTCHAKK